MNKIVKIALGVVALILLIIVFRWCGNGSGSTSEATRSQDTVAMLKPYNTAVKGYFSDVLEVVDEAYKLEYKSEYPGKGTIQVKIKSIGKGDSKDYGLNDRASGPLYLVICDKDGMPITEFAEASSSYRADELLSDMVTKAGKDNWIEFGVNQLKGGIFLPTEAVAFIVTSKQKEKREDSESSSTTSSTSSSSDDSNMDEIDGLFDDDNDEQVSTSKSSSNTESWDKVMDEYEKYCDDYIELLKKAQKNDTRALADAMKLMEQAEKFQTKLGKAQSEMSSSQVRRMMKVQNKFLEAAAEMQKEAR